jgi:hypothetical protein
LVSATRIGRQETPVLPDAHGDDLLAAGQRRGELALAFGRRAIGGEVRAALGAVKGERERVDAVGLGLMTFRAEKARRTAGRGLAALSSAARVGSGVR